MPHRCHWITTLFGFYLLTAHAHSQIFSAYVTSSNTSFSNVLTDYANVTDPQTTSFWVPTVGGGLTFGISSIGPIHLGLDLRGSTRPGLGGADTAFAGVKLALKPPLLKIKPYVQASGGYLQTRTNAVLSGHSITPSTFNNQYIGYQIFGGLDIPMLPILDFRAIEIGGGKAYSITTLSTTYTPSINPGLFTINTGFVFHF